MGEKTKISWCDHTFNPWIGCNKVDGGCTNCYAETLMDGRYGKVKWGPHGTRSRTGHDYWLKPGQWNRNAKAAGVRRRVFCASLADVFEDWTGPIVDHNQHRLFVADVESGPMGPLTMKDLRIDLFRLIDETPWLDWLVLTKRPENIRSMIPARVNGYATEYHEWYRLNLWLGTSVSDQKTADTMLPELYKCRDLCPVLFASYEPALGPVHFKQFEPQLGWVIVGGESGPDARPFDVDWAESAIEQCRAACIAVFVKQLGSRPIRMNGGLTWEHTLTDKKGGDPAEWPEHLRVRQFPELKVSS